MVACIPPGALPQYTAALLVGRRLYARVGRTFGISVCTSDEFLAPFLRSGSPSPKKPSQPARTLDKPGIENTRELDLHRQSVIPTKTRKMWPRAHALTGGMQGGDEVAARVLEFLKSHALLLHRQTAARSVAPQGLVSGFTSGASDPSWLMSKATLARHERQHAMRRTCR
jgi:hypothetical protein